MNARLVSMSSACTQIFGIGWSYHVGGTLSPLRSHSLLQNRSVLFLDSYGKATNNHKEERLERLTVVGRSDRDRSAGAVGERPTNKKHSCSSPIGRQFNDGPKTTPT